MGWTGRGKSGADGKKEKGAEFEDSRCATGPCGVTCGGFGGEGEADTRGTQDPPSKNEDGAPREEAES